VQECGVGLVRIRRDERGGISRADDEERRGPLTKDEVVGSQRGLGVRARHRGARVVRQRSALERRDAEVGRAACSRCPYRWSRCSRASTRRGGAGEGGVVPRRCRGRTRSSRCAVCARQHGWRDPVTGSMNAALRQWLIGAFMRRHGKSRGRARRSSRAGRVS